MEDSVFLPRSLGGVVLVSAMSSACTTVETPHPKSTSAYFRSCTKNLSLLHGGGCANQGKQHSSAGMLTASLAVLSWPHAGWMMLGLTFSCRFCRSLAAFSEGAVVLQHVPLLTAGEEIALVSHQKLGHVLILARWSLWMCMYTLLYIRAGRLSRGNTGWIPGIIQETGWTNGLGWSHHICISCLPLS